MNYAKPLALVASCGAVAALGVGASTTASAAGLRFPSCAAAAAAGYHDMPIGSPGYRPGLDANHNNIACETDQPSAPKPSTRPTAGPVAPSHSAPAPKPAHPMGQPVRPLAHPQKPMNPSVGPKVQTDEVPSGSRLTPVAVTGLAGLTLAAGGGVVLARRRNN